MADFKRKPGESFESFLRKFKKGLKNNKRLEKARSKQYIEPKMTKRLQKKHALAGLALSKKNEHLRRIGKLPESTRRS
ncbi:30S ribosomal protein S21 [Candidatus Falkowbacteria bacterium]|jgi:ribosomal protein S21|nr:30S ribosomal protein S21 [Candidatus Falkowbacteria bacterium]